MIENLMKFKSLSFIEFSFSFISSAVVVEELFTWLHNSKGDKEDANKTLNESS